MKVIKKGKEKITLYYGKQKLSGENYNHKGIDIVKSSNDLEYIIAIAKGKVIKTVINIKGFKENSYGNHVIIEHANGIKTLYAHMKFGSIVVKKGDIIEKGKAIGYMGNTGSAYGAHLHFEVLVNGKNVNPLPYITGKKFIPGYTEKDKYTKGKYITKYVMKVRQGPSTKYIQKKVKDLSLDERKNATLQRPSSNAAYKAGTIFTALDIVYENENTVWAKTPSGYICIKDKTIEYCQKNITK